MTIDHSQRFTFVKLIIKSILMKITKRTIVYDILVEYGDIAEIMEMLGVKRVGNYSFRKFLTRFITVRIAAFVHRVPLDEFINKLNKAIFAKQKMNISKD